MSTEPTNEDLARISAKEMAQAQHRREAKDLKRLERHGQIALQAIEAEQADAKQKVELKEVDGQQSEEVGGDEIREPTKEPRAREIAEKFKEKAARDREESRSFSR